MMENLFIALSVCGVYGIMAVGAIIAASYLASIIKF